MSSNVKENDNLSRMTVNFLVQTSILTSVRNVAGTSLEAAQQRIPVQISDSEQDTEPRISSSRTSDGQAFVSK